MAKIAAKNSQVLVEVANSPTKLTNCADWTLNCERNTIDVSTIGTEWKEFLSGQINGNGSCTILYDPLDMTAGTGIENALFDGTNIRFYVRPQGSESGAVQYTIPALITSWNITGSTEDAIRVSVNFQGTGAITKGTVTE